MIKTMPEIYQPRKLPRNREYPGYQFYCTVQKTDGNSEDCFCLTVLCVIDWLKERLRETDVIPQEIARLPGRQNAGEISSDDLKSFTISSGFSAYVVSLPGHGIWCLRLKEPDSDTDHRKAVPGRFFATNIGIHIINGKQIEFGIRIDVTDPEETSEVDFAFRPKLVRYLFEAPNLMLTQASKLLYREPMIVENDEQLKQLRTILDSTDCVMPVILVTQAIRLSGEESASLFSKPAFPVNASVPSSGVSPTIPVLEKYYPFDANDIASHNFGYAITGKVSEDLHRQLAARLKKDYTPGDILFVEPRRFGGHVRILGKTEKDAKKQIWDRAHCYSKHRKYYFGDIQFEFDARNIENRELIEQIRTSGEMATEEKLTRLNQKIDELQEENIKRVQKINELKEQLLSEFRRGEAAEKVRTEQLFEDFDRHEEELRAVRARNMQLEQENREARAHRSAVEAFRSMPELPRTNEDVIHYFQRVFGDRIAFTERGIKTGCKCGIKAEGLWFYLYHMATSLFDIHHAGVPDVEKAFLHAAGIEVAMGEGSNSRKDNKIMALRKDVFEGKEISVEPHIKLTSQRAGADYQRIYYCYDHETDRIIVGWIGDHMRNFGTLNAN